jgi:hypothetical protein
MSPSDLFALVLLCAGAAAGERSEEDPKTVVTVSGLDLTVRVKILPKASLASTGWLSLELENTGREPMIVTNAFYRFDAERCDPKTGERRSSCGLSFGTTYDLFPDAWKTRPVSTIVLEPSKVHVVTDQPSDYSAALLGLAPEEGWRVRARFHVNLDLKGRGRMGSADEGLPFEFHWGRPDKAGFAELRARLMKILEGPEKKMHRAYLLSALLDVPDVARTASCADLLAAVAKRESGAEGREMIARHLGKRFKGDPAVVAFYKERVEAGDAHAVYDLGAVWDKAFVEPLVRLYEEQGERHAHVLPLLHNHRSDWAKNADLAARLSAAYRKLRPIVDKNVAELTVKQLPTWAHELQYLAMTGDRTLVASLRPLLDDRRVFRKSREAVSAIMTRPATLRVCDCALDAILTLLDGNADEPYAKAGLSGFKSWLDDAKVSEFRDKMIADLKRRLAEDKK